MDKRTSRKRGQRHKRTQTAKRMFIRGFLQSFFIVAILLSAGILGYQTTMRLWWVAPKEVVMREEMAPTPVPITVASVDEVSKNLIFSYNPDTHIINSLILEVFHCERKQLTYITIPLSTQFTMSDILYKRLIAVQPSIPQVFRLSTMTRYLSTEQVFDYGVLLLEDMLNLDISYYTVLPIDLFQAVFEEKNIVDGITAVTILDGIENPFDGEQQGNYGDELMQEQQPVVAQVFTRAYMEEMEGIRSVMELSTYIETMYDDLVSNLSLREKMNYLESYSKTSWKDIRFTRIAGYDRNNGFAMDESRVLLQLQSLGVY